MDADNITPITKNAHDLWWYPKSTKNYIRTQLRSECVLPNHQSPMSHIVLLPDDTGALTSIKISDKCLEQRPTGDWYMFVPPYTTFTDRMEGRQVSAKEVRHMSYEYDKANPEDWRSPTPETKVAIDIPYTDFSYMDMHIPADKTQPATVSLPLKTGMHLISIDQNVLTVDKGGLHISAEAQHQYYARANSIQHAPSGYINTDELKRAFEQWQPEPQLELEHTPAHKEKTPAKKPRRRLLPDPILIPEPEKLDDGPEMYL